MNTNPHLKIGMTRTHHAVLITTLELMGETSKRSPTYKSHDPQDRKRRRKNIKPKSHDRAKFIDS